MVGCLSSTCAGCAHGIGFERWAHVSSRAYGTSAIPHIIPDVKVWNITMIGIDTHGLSCQVSTGCVPRIGPVCDATW